MVYHYEFSTDFTQVLAYDEHDNYVSGVDYRTVSWLGKRGNIVKNKPAAFSNSQKFTIPLGTLSNCLVYHIIETMNNNENWFAENKDYYKFVADVITNKREYMLPILRENLCDFYQQLKLLGRDTLKEEDQERICLMAQYRLSYLCQHYAEFCDNIEIYEPIFRHPIFANSFINGQRHCQTVNSKKGYSANWLANIYYTMINDGIEIETPFTAMRQGIYNPGDIWNLIIQNYYFGLVELGEHENPPIEEGFFMDYARVQAMREAKYETLLQFELDKNTFRHDPITFEGITYTQVTTTSQLKSLTLLFMGSSSIFRMSICEHLAAGGFIVMPSIGTPFMVANNRVVSLIRGFDELEISKNHKAYLDFVSSQLTKP